MTQPLRALIVEDVDRDAQLLVHELRRGGFDVTFERVDTPEAMSAMLAKQAWDIVFCDYSMPRFDAPAALALLRARGLDIPFIIVSGTVGEDTAVAAMRAGAHDYFLKDKLGPRLSAAVERELRDAQAREERGRAQRHAQQLEGRVRASDERYRQLVDQAYDVICVLTPDGIIREVNASGERMLGGSKDELLGRSYRDWIAPEDRDRADAAFKRLGVERHILASGLAMPRLDGSQWIADVSAVLVDVVDVVGEQLILVIARDVTAQRQTEEALRDSEKQFRTLVSSMDDLVFILDASQRYVGVFGRSVQRDGLTPEHFLGKTAREIVGSSAAPPHEAANARALSGESVVYEWSVDDPNGTRHHQTSLSPMHDATGAVSGIVGIARETTDAKRIQTQLMVSDRMASVGMLAAGVAHEINNPLACVMANLELVTHEVEKLTKRGQLADAAELNEELRDAREGADRVRQIVRDLKIFSRNEAESHGPVSVRRVLESSLRMTWNEIRHRAKLVKEYGDIPEVDINEARLGQVFLNLLVNAAQAIPEGDVESHEIRVVTSTTSAGFVQIEIRDTGSGITPESLRKLFTPFFTTKPPGVGTGLGLSICQRIVSLAGGEIQVESHVGKGTTFRVLLPAAQTHLIETPMPPARVQGPLRRGQVLVVDDEPLIGSAIGRVLANEHDVTLATRALEALELIVSGRRFDVIFCDVMMPQVTGMEFYEELHGRVPDQAAHIVFLTGGAFTTLAKEFLDKTPNMRIEKPFEAAQLRSVVNAHVR